MSKVTAADLSLGARYSHASTQDDTYLCYLESSSAQERGTMTTPLMSFVIPDAGSEHHHYLDSEIYRRDLALELHVAVRLLGTTVGFEQS